MKKILLGLLCCFFIQPIQAQNSAPAMQWHFDGNRQVNIMAPGIDWVFDVFPTPTKQYIACGYTGTGPLLPVIFKLDNAGKLVWAKTINGISGTSYNLTYNTDAGGILF